MNRIARSMLLGLLSFGPAVYAQEDAKPASNDAYQSISQFKVGENRKGLTEIEADIRAAKPDGYAGIEQKLLKLLESADTSVDAKRYVARYLGTVGSEKSVPTLTKLLTDKDLSHPARIALEVIPHDSAGEALRQSLTTLKGDLLAGAVGSVGARRDAKAVTALAKLVGDADPNIASAAALALGQIGNVDAAKALEQAQGSASEKVIRSVLRARLNAAEKLAQGGNTQAAAAIYKGLMNDKSPAAQKVAALRGLVLVSDRPAAVAQLTEVLNGTDEKLRTGALAAFRQSPDATLRAAVVEKLPSLNPTGQLALLGVLSDFPDAPARQSLLEIVRGNNDPARAAAVECLAVHGDVSDVTMLARLASSADGGAVKDAARKSLEQLGARGVDDSLTQMVSTVEPAQRVVIISALAKRGARSAMPMLVKLLTGSDANASSEAAGALATLGGVDELTALVGTVEKTSDDKVRNAARNAAGEICTRLADSKTTGPVVLGTLAKASTAPARTSLIQLLPRVRGDEALAAVKTATKDADTAIREAAIRALTDWPESSAANALFEVAETADERQAILALQGAIRLGGQRELSNSDRVNIYKKVIDSAKRNDEKKRAIAGLAEVPNNDAVETLAKLAEDPELVADVAQAAVRMARPPQGGGGGRGGFGGFGLNRARLNEVLDKLKENPSLSAEVKKQIEEARNQPAPAGRRGR